MSVYHDAIHKLFSLVTENAVYFLHIHDDGRLLHLGSGVMSGVPNEGEVHLAHALQYLELEKGTDRQQLREEFPAKGDVNYHEQAIAAVFPGTGCALEGSGGFSGGVRDFRPRYVSHRIVENEEPWLSPQHGLEPRVNDYRQTLAVLMRDPVYNFTLEIFYRVTPEHDIIERWVEVRNETPQAVKLEHLSFACLHLPLNHTSLSYVTGSTGREFQQTSVELKQGIHVLEQGGLNTGHGHNPFFFIHEPGGATEEHGPVFFGALGYSGNWSMRFEILPNGCPRVFGGYGKWDFEFSLPPGGVHRTPAMIFGWSADGIGGGSRQLHRFVRERILPSTDVGERPVLYNSWEATNFDISEEQQLKLAGLASSIGIELFCVDDGWFGERSSSRAGLGDWTPRTSAFPNGLRALSDSVHGLGMKFGLWVEPEMVNPDSNLYRAHPDWVLHYPGRPRTEARNQLILDFGREEVVEYLFSALCRVVEENGVDFFKWDMNRYATEPGSVAGQAIWFEHVKGVYWLMDQLRFRFPKLEIQSCSAGGGRIDAGILARCDQAWISDNTDAHERTGIQEGYSLAYPLRTMECWVTDEVNRLTNRTSSLALRFDVAMRGCLGIGTPLSELGSQELEEFRKFIAFYKMIRPVVQNGDLYRLDTVSRDSASLWLIVSQDRLRAVFSSVILATRHGMLRGPFRLHGLDKNHTYRVLNHLGEEIGQYPGWQLISVGLPDDHITAGACRSVRSRTLMLEAT